MSDTPVETVSRWHGDPLLVVYKDGTWAPYVKGQQYLSDDIAWPVFIRWSIYFGSHPSDRR